MPQKDEKDFGVRIMNHKPAYVFAVFAASFGILGASCGIWSGFNQAAMNKMDSTISEQSIVIDEQNVTLKKYSDKIEKLETKNDKAAKTIKDQKAEIKELKEIAAQAKAQKAAQVYSVQTSSPSTSSATASGGSYIGDFTITYYCGENYPHICGTGNGVTASGVTAQVGVTIAADPNVLPIGTRVYIEGIGERVVQDVGGVIIGNKIDVFVGSHSEAMSNGRHTAKVYRR